MAHGFLLKQAYRGTGSQKGSRTEVISCEVTTWPPQARRPRRLSFSAERTLSWTIHSYFATLGNHSFCEKNYGNPKRPGQMSETPKNAVGSVRVRFAPSPT